MIRRSRVASILCVAFLACGGSSFEGTVNGITLSVKESAFFPLKDGSGNLSGLQLWMSDTAGLCESLKAGTNVRNSTTFSAALREVSGGALVPPTTGDYDFRSTGQSKVATVFVTKQDATCGTAAFAQGGDGKVTLNGYKAEAEGTMSGSFDGTFVPGGAHGSGHFDAVFCDAPGTLSGCR